METDVSLPCTEEHGIVPYHDEVRSHRLIIIIIIYFNTLLQSIASLCKLFLFSGFSITITSIYNLNMYTTCRAH
jgi:hypothetical protein